VPDWKPEIRRRLAGLKLEPTREAAILEELAHHLDDHYAELLSSGARQLKPCAGRAELSEPKITDAGTATFRTAGRARAHHCSEPIGGAI
jgi:hypothetical protein